MRRAAASVVRTISSGSLPGTMVVTNATRSTGSGRTGTGSLASSEASDSDTTLTSRSTSTSATAPMTKTLAASTGHGSSKSGWCAGASNHSTNAASTTTLATRMATVRTASHRPRPGSTRWNRTRYGPSDGSVSGPAIVPKSRRGGVAVSDDNGLPLRALTRSGGEHTKSK